MTKAKDVSDEAKDRLLDDLADIVEEKDALIRELAAALAAVGDQNTYDARRVLAKAKAQGQGTRIRTMTGLAEEIGRQFEEQQALIRELAAALEQIAEADQKLTNCWSAAEAFHWCNSRAEVALAKAKEQGFEP